MSLESSLLVVLLESDAPDNLARELIAEVLANWERRIRKAKREHACADLFGYFHVSRQQIAEETKCHRSTVYRTRKKLVAKPPVIATAA